MNQLLRKASLDERSIEYEMGLALFGSSDHHSSNGNSTSGNYSSPIQCNSIDAYERMRTEFQSGITSSSFSHEDISVGIVSEGGYSSPGDFHMEMSSLEGDMDWVKMSAKKLEFDYPHQYPVSTGAYQQ
jgi:hypothetical protein